MESFDHIRCLQETGFTIRQIKAMGEQASEVAGLPRETRIELRNRLMGERICQGGSAPEFSVKPDLPEPAEQKSGIESQVNIQEEKKKEDGLQMFRNEMTKWFGEMFQKNNELIIRQVEDSVVETMETKIRYLFREQEEKEEERFKRLDKTIRETQMKCLRRQAEQTKRFLW